LNIKQAVTIAIESGIQNGTLTISLAVITLAKPEYAIVAAIYGPLMYLMASVPIAIGVRDSKK
jgi:BASS family bile acid:Na+ symporter